MTDSDMANNSLNPEDLEDGEIESDDCGDAKVDAQAENKHEQKADVNKDNEIYYSKSGKKKKSKNKEHKSKDKVKKHKRSSPPADDFAGSIEKAIRKAMNKDDSESDDYGDVDERRKRKKKKKQDGKEGSSKKRKKQEYFDEVDENEMMCVRGASPVHRNSPSEDTYNDDDSYASDSSQGSRDFRRHRPLSRKNKSDRRRNNHPIQDPDGVCVYFMQGKCHKGDSCIYSHDANPPRKMELCKFYLMDCCAKRDKCLYMHSDFPCKFYHTGLPCIYKDDCKFAHGKHLSDPLKLILLKHIESAPKEILGDFPRLTKEGAANMIHNTQIKLMQQFGCEAPKETQEKNIPSLFEINIPKPPNITEPTNVLSNNDKGSKSSPKIRQSRWQNEDSSSQLIEIPPQINVLNIKNLNGVLTPRQISDLGKMGIDNLEQLGQLTVLQLNSIGISLKQITEIQLNTMNIQKLGLINSNSESITPAPTLITSAAKDLDLRVPPVAPVASSAIIGDLSGKDIDMRFQHTTPNVQNEEDSQENKLSQLQPNQARINKDMIDIDQYTKDALKFAVKDNDNTDQNTESLKNNKTYSNNALTLQSKDIDQRILKFADQNDTNIYNKTNDNFDMKKDADTDIRFLQPEPIFKNPGKYHRRSTTDDEDNNLLIDEKWYSSDEDKPLKRKSQSSSPIPTSPQSVPQIQAIEPASVLSKLGDLSKIAISDEVTQLLNKMKNNLQDSKPNENNVSCPKEQSDTRTVGKSSPEHKSNNLVKELGKSNKRVPKVSIYECIEGEPTDGRRRTDVDLRQNDFKLPGFGDTDLRTSMSGDIDLRLGLPFKPIPNYTPASEIDGSINSHAPIPYKVVVIDIPRPDYTDIRNSTAKSQALVDPRLRKVFRLSIDDSNSDSEKSTKPAAVTAAPRVDPRRKQKEITEEKPTLDLSTILQNSDWYKDLSSTQKIYVNQNLALVTSMIKQHQQDKTSGNKLDLAPIQSNTVLVNIFTNLGVVLNENAEFSYIPKQKEALLKTPINFNQGYAMPGANFDSNNMNMMNMNMGGPMNNMNMGPMPSYNHPGSDPRGGPAPGLLGVAPNIPHNFDNNFGGMNNFGNMPYNGSNNDFGNMNSEPNFQRFPNRGGGYRGRGNDRWNRGGAARGHRDRNRGGWKGDRKQ